MGGGLLRLRQGTGLALLVLCLVPFWRGLPDRDTGLAGRATADLAAGQVAFLWNTTLLLLIAGVLGAMVLRPEVLRRAGQALDSAAGRVPVWVVALGAAGLAGLGTSWAALEVFGGRPALVDAQAQLVHARYLAAGQLAGPIAAAMDPAFVHLQNTVWTEVGWVSQYPPGHALLLAVGLAAGAVWAVGPVLMAATAALSVLLFARLLPLAPVEARLAGVLTGLSPLLLLQAATYMSHASAALLSVVALYAAARAVQAGGGDKTEAGAEPEPGAPGMRGLGWAAAAGAGVTALAAVRPLTAVVVMLAIVGGVWGRALVELVGQKGRAFAGWTAAATLGGLPFLGLQLFYNQVVFGGPLTFGYDVAWGPDHGLGFGTDPWGNTYGVLEAVMYTSVELGTLNLNLLEVPLPLVALVGVFLLCKGCLSMGERTLALWAALLVVLNGLYWHHGYFMGPRMLADAAPAWVALVVVGAGWALRRTPEALPGGGRLSPRGGLAGLLGAGLVVGLVLAPMRAGSFAPGPDPVEEALGQVPAEVEVVFAHGTWEGRLQGRLVATGQRLDLVETALRQNPACEVHEAVLGLERSGGGGLAGASLGSLLDTELDLEPGAREFLPRPEVAPGIRVRMDPEAPLSYGCEIELHADRHGGVEVGHELWQLGLPGIGGGPLLVRDLGPDRNRQLLEALGIGRGSAVVLGRFREDGPLEVQGYAQGMAELWEIEEP